MAKRKEVSVDEDLIKSMMTRDIPRLGTVPVNEKKEPEQVIDEENPVMDAPAPREQKRRREPKDYSLLFLQKSGGAKRQTYINADLHDTISKILGIIARDISVPNFIDNVLENHLKEYKNEINDLYKDNSDLPL